MKTWSLKSRLAWLTLKITFPPLIKRLYQFKVLGRENVPPEGEGVIIAANHRSHFDSIAIGVALAPRLSLFMASKKVMMANPFFRLLKHIGAFPVDQRPGKGELALEYARRSVKRGFAVIIYPEGKRIKNPSEFGRAKTGVARIAIPTSKPVIPTYVSGTSEILPLGTMIPQIRKEIIVAFGKPIQPQKYVTSHDNLVDAIRALTNDIMMSIYQLYQDVETQNLADLQKKQFGDDIFTKVLDWLEKT